jgi:hypothetical protein
MQQRLDVREVSDVFLEDNCRCCRRTIVAAAGLVMADVHAACAIFRRTRDIKSRAMQFATALNSCTELFGMRHTCGEHAKSVLICEKSEACFWQTIVAAAGLVIADITRPALFLAERAILSHARCSSRPRLIRTLGGLGPADYQLPVLDILLPQGRAALQQLDADAARLMTATSSSRR